LFMTVFIGFQPVGYTNHADWFVPNTQRHA
jgi:hypothetical protein